jgi:hypothetical protein
MDRFGVPVMVVGFLLSALLGAGFALLGGVALDTLGVAALAIGATVAVLLPVATLLRRRTDVRRISAAT